MTNEEIDQRIAAIEARAADAASTLRDRLFDDNSPFVEAVEDDTAWLIEQLQAARKDSLRLDWLEAERPRVGLGENGEARLRARNTTGTLLAMQPTLREAIDAAMSAAPLSDKEAAT